MTVELLPVSGERVAVAYEQTALPAYFFRAPDSRPGERRPLVIINNGSDGATSQAWGHGGAAAGERGYHWLTFEGPGQQSALDEQAMPSGPDWEAFLTPVLDATLGRAEVDADRVAIIGIGHAGYWVPRALAFEHRLAAAVADPGIIDVSTAWLNALPDVMRQQLRDGEGDAFDREMRLAELFSPATAATLRSYAKPFGLGGGSPFEVYEAVRAYRLGDELQQISTPLLITEPEDERHWPGQSQQLYDRLPGAKELMRLSSPEGGCCHDQPLACGPRDAHIFDWLDTYLA
jgi:hypothetical protein